MRISGGGGGCLEDSGLVLGAEAPLESGFWGPRPRRRWRGTGKARVRKQWPQLPRRRGQGQEATLASRVPGVPYTRQRAVFGVGGQRGHSQECPRRLSPGGAERLGSLRFLARKPKGLKNPVGPESSPGQDHEGHPDL